MKQFITAPPEERTVQTPLGELPYTLTRKRVKNLNLRVRADGAVAVSAPPCMTLAFIEGFLRERAEWIEKNRVEAINKPQPLPCRYTKVQCLELFTAVSDGVFPLFADLLGGHKPQIKVREMKTRWGVCNMKKRIITLNSRLAEKPRAALEYVILHEYVHFLHPNHQAAFHAEMARLMPDYRRRKKLLRD